MALPSPDFSIVTELFTETYTLGTEWLIPLAIAIVAMAIVTRDTEKWKVMSFPIFVLLRIMGMPVHFVLLAGSALMFVIEALSTQLGSGLIGTVKKWVGKDPNMIQADQIEKRGKILSMFQKAKKQEEYLGSYAQRTVDIRDKKGRKLKVPTGIDQRKMRELIELRRRMGLE